MTALRRVVATVGLSTGVVVAASVPALAAGSPHFIKHATYASISGSVLTVHFKEAGLPAGAVETVRADADAATTYECVNGGGSNPAASNKHTIKSHLSNSGTFTAGTNGTVSGWLTLGAPSAADLGFSCPPGQTTTFVSAVFTHVSVTDLTSGAFLAIKGTFSDVNPDAPPVR